MILRCGPKGLLWLGVVLCCVAGGTARAEEHFSCGGAEVKFSFEVSPDPDSVTTVLTVGRAGLATSLRYDGKIDFIGGTCAKDARGKPMIVYQAYCGGSGCYDLDNWGIIDPKDLRVLLVPNDWNRGIAAKILGKARPKIPHIIAIADEAEKLGTGR